MAADPTISDEMGKALDEATAAMKQYSVSYALIGGLAASYRSQPRFTKTSSLQTRPSSTWIGSGRNGRTLPVSTTHACAVCSNLSANPARILIKSSRGNRADHTRTEPLDKRKLQPGELWYRLHPERPVDGQVLIDREIDRTGM
jgi:hypothetical protein